MKDYDYWKHRYVITTNAESIADELKRIPFTSDGRDLELICFLKDTNTPTILISPGSGGHAYVFAELDYFMHRRGYNVFIMPKHGPLTIVQLCTRHLDALHTIEHQFNDRIGAFAEGLGGFAVFYLALAYRFLKSAVYQNAPAVLTERAYHEAIVRGRRAALRRSFIIPIAPLLARFIPSLKIPIASYLDFEELIDPKPENRRIETELVKGFREDRDFDRRYPLSAVLSLITTPPPSPLSSLTTPTLFIVPRRGLIPAYFEDLFARLSPIKKKLIDVDGGVFWMISHPQDAATMICDWFAETFDEDILNSGGDS